MNNKIGYYAILLDNQSQEKLKQFLTLIKSQYPIVRQFGFTKCEHMVIRFSDYGINKKDTKIGTPVRLKCRQFGFNDKAVAVHVNKIERKIDNRNIVFEEPHNESYHITLAHRDKHDAKESNNIESWKAINDLVSSELVLSGTICDYRYDLMGWDCLSFNLSSSVSPYIERTNYGIFE
jgi:hypothetical protein